MCVCLSLQYTALQMLGEERLLRQNGQDQEKEKHGKSHSARTTDNGEIETQRAAGEGVRVGGEVPEDPSGGGAGEWGAENVVHLSDCARVQTWPLAGLQEQELVQAMWSAVSVPASGGSMEAPHERHVRWSHVSVPAALHGQSRYKILVSCPK
jgi:hypothetical protein